LLDANVLIALVISDHDQPFSRLATFDEASARALPGTVQVIPR
jgi:hypothetical protein